MLKDEEGISLVELIAALALMSIVILLISSVHIFGQNQFTNQSTQIENQSDVRIAINEITRDIRSGQSVSTTDDNVLIIDTVEYKRVGNTIKKGNRNVADNIKDFCVNNEGCMNEKSNEINLKITGVENQHGIATSLSSVIYLRE